MNNLKLIIIGELCWFPDSWLLFQEREFDITVIKTQSNFIWWRHYELFTNLGIKVVENTLDNVEKIQSTLDSKTLVVGGGTFMNNQKEYHLPSVLPTGLEELDILYRLSKFSFDEKRKATFVRFFNGETGFGDEETAKQFAKKTQYVDAFMFDNDQLKDFVLANDPNARNKQLLLGWVETPLERFCYHNTGKIERKICSLGRVLCSAPSWKLDLSLLPMRRFPGSKIKFLDRIRGRKEFYQMAGAVDNVNILYRDRKLFYRLEASCAFGISNMYDIFSGSIEDYHRHRDFYFSPFGQTMPHNVCSCHETYYQFCNNANKDVCYLMNGIIPLIPHTEHNVYKSLIEKKMAILIRCPEDIGAVLTISDAEIQEYRDNIYANRDLFTFDHVAEMLSNLIEH